MPAAPSSSPAPPAPQGCGFKPAARPAAVSRLAPPLTSFGKERLCPRPTPGGPSGKVIANPATVSSENSKWLRIFSAFVRGRGLRALFHPCPIIRPPRRTRSRRRRRAGSPLGAFGSLGVTCSTTARPPLARRALRRPAQGALLCGAFPTGNRCAASRGGWRWSRASCRALGLPRRRGCGRAAARSRLFAATRTRCPGPPCSTSPDLRRAPYLATGSLSLRGGPLRGRR